MKQLYLFKAFFILCAVYFAFNLVQLIQSHDYAFEMLFQFSLLVISVWLTISIRLSTAQNHLKTNQSKPTASIRQHPL